MNDLLTEFLRVLRSGEVTQAIGQFRHGDARCVAGLGLELAGAEWNASQCSIDHWLPYYTDKNGNEVWQSWLDDQLNVRAGTMKTATNMNNAKVPFPQLAGFIESCVL